jgi:mannose-1-phosphate guanylyltransferase
MNTWALVLAGGEGRRLERLTTDLGGRRIPKQFCSLNGGVSLLEETVARAEGLCARERICTIVTEEHRQWWTAPLRRLPAENIVVQPTGRGTAHGILLPVLHILARDPTATILVLPSDHFVPDEATLCRAMTYGVAAAETEREYLFLLGIEPDEGDPDLGYVLTALQPGETVRMVQQFVEKPPTWREASRLIQQGAMWNSLIFAASASALVSLFAASNAPTVRLMRAAVDQHLHAGGTHAIQGLFESLSHLDFCKDVLTGQEARLRLVPVPPCGWSDLGTPPRVERALRRLEGRRRPTASGEHALRPLILRDQISRAAHGARVHME